MSINQVIRGIPMRACMSVVLVWLLLGCQPKEVKVETPAVTTPKPVYKPIPPKRSWTFRNDREAEAHDLPDTTTLSDPRMLLAGHDKIVRDVAFSPNGRMIATAGWDRLVKVWDADTKRPVVVFKGHLGNVNTVAFSPDGRWLASGSEDNTIRLWDVVQKKAGPVLRGHSSWIRDLAYSPDGKLLGSASQDKTVWLWSTETHSPVARLTGHLDGVYTLAFSPDGIFLVSGGQDKTVRLWHVQRKSLVKTFLGHTNKITSLAYSPGGHYVASGSTDRTVKIWDMWRQQLLKTLPAHDDWIWAVAFSPEGRYLATGGVDKRVTLWDTHGYRKSHVLDGYKDWIWSLAYSPDGRYLAAGLNNNQVRLWPRRLPGRFTISGLAVDWNIGKPENPPFPVTTLELVNKDTVQAGQALDIRVSVINKGRGDLYQVKGTLTGPGTSWHNYPVYFGRVKPGQVATRQIRFPIDRAHSQEENPVSITFSEANGIAPKRQDAIVVIKPHPRPILAYSFRAIDDGSGNSVGNGDGQIQASEGIDLQITIANEGTGLAKGVTGAVTQSSATADVALYNGAFRMGDIKPGEAKAAKVTFQVKPTATNLREILLAMQVGETSWNAGFKDTIKLQMDSNKVARVAQISRPVWVASGAALHAGAGDRTGIVARVESPVRTYATGRLGEWYRVRLNDSQIAWVSVEHILKDAPHGVERTNENSGIVLVYRKSPPNIVRVEPIKSQFVTTGSMVRVRGAVVDDNAVADFKVLVNGSPALLRGHRGIGVAAHAQQTLSRTFVGPLSFERLPFDFTVSLLPGNNEIEIIATDNDGMSKTDRFVVAREEEKGRFLALVVGIGMYEDQSIPALKYTDADAYAVYSFFKNSDRSPVQNPGTDVHWIRGREATLRGIRESIEKHLIQQATEKDTVVFYFSGHGDIGPGGKYYMIPQNAKKSALRSTAIELSELQGLWTDIRAKRKIFITDACNSGGFISLKAPGARSYTDLIGGEGSVVMAASAAGQASVEIDAYSHGLYTYYLLKGLSGVADRNADKRVSVRELATYLDESVPDDREAAKLSVRQHPAVKLEIDGDIFLTR